MVSLHREISATNSQRRGVWQRDPRSVRETSGLGFLIVLVDTLRTYIYGTATTFFDDLRVESCPAMHVTYTRLLLVRRFVFCPNIDECIQQLKLRGAGGCGGSRTPSNVENPTPTLPPTFRSAISDDSS